jgi:dihydroorotate dehydrogenase (fumarate)
MAKLTTDLCGLELRNPLVLASGPLSFDGEALLRAHRAGAGAVVTKTILREPARNPVPHMVKLRSGLLNAEKWSDLPAQTWVEREIPVAKEGGAVVIASLGMAAADAGEFAPALVSAGADALEVCSYEAQALAPMVSVVVPRAEHVPVFAKVSANWPDVTEIAAECLRRGASGITAIDSVGPALRIDIQRRIPLLGAGYGWLSGEAILPISLRVVARISLATRATIVGTGGVRQADDCIEMLMAGARAIGVCTLPILAGVGAFAELASALSARLDTLGYASAEEAMGAALPSIEEFERTPMLVPARAGGEWKLSFAWAAGTCTGCGFCVRVCPYQARTAPDRFVKAACRYCGLCASVCPTGALSLLVEGNPVARSGGRRRGRQ